MSYTTLYKVPQAGEITVFEEFQNSHRGAAMLWDYLGSKYVLRFEGMFNEASSDKVWELAKDERVERYERDVLLTTFDLVMLKREHFERVANAMDRVGAKMTRRSGGFGELETTEQDGGHYPEQAAALRRLSADVETVAACWDQTSVADDQWQRYDEEEWRMFDLSRDSGHWFMLRD